jgi:hypothetical protein
MLVGKMRFERLLILAKKKSLVDLVRNRPVGGCLLPDHEARVGNGCLQVAEIKGKSNYKTLHLIARHKGIRMIRIVKKYYF